MANRVDCKTDTTVSVNVGSYAYIMLTRGGWDKVITIPTRGSFPVKKCYLDKLLNAFNGWIKQRDGVDWDMTSFTRYIVRPEVDPQ